MTTSADDGTRTHNHVIKNHLLYQLSYIGLYDNALLRKQKVQLKSVALVSVLKNTINCRTKDIFHIS